MSLSPKRFGWSVRLLLSCWYRNLFQPSWSTIYTFTPSLSFNSSLIKILTLRGFKPFYTSYILKVNGIWGVRRPVDLWNYLPKDLCVFLKSSWVYIYRYSVSTIINCLGRTHIGRSFLYEFFLSVWWIWVKRGFRELFSISGTPKVSFLFIISECSGRCFLPDINLYSKVGIVVKNYPHWSSVSDILPISEFLWLEI